MAKVAWTALAVSFACLGPAQGATLGHFTSAYFFGDSLTDPGNLYALTSSAIGTGVPPAPYWEGRTSNGRVWAEHVADDFTAKGLPTANYAYAYGQAVKNVDTQFGPLQVPDLPDQIDTFAGSGAHLGKRPVAMVWFGSNDLFTAMRGDPASVGSVAAGAAQAVVDGIGALSTHGFKDVVVFNVPPLELAPNFAGTPAAGLAKLGADTFNETLDGLLKTFSGVARVTTLDIHAAQLAVIANPEKYGVSDVTTACFTGATLCSNPQDHLYFDGVHPTAGIHGAIADIVRSEVAPVPLPASAWLLLAGFLALAFVGVGRRRLTEA